RHRIAFVSMIVLALMYLVALVPEFLAPTGPEALQAAYAYAPPQAVRFDGGLHVFDYTSEVDPRTNAISYSVDESRRIDVGLFVRGEPYRLFGLIPGDRHLIGPVDPSRPFFLLGADANGHDLLSRLIYGTRISLSVGLIGVLLAFVLGILLGGLSGYFGGRVDNAIQRLIEFFMSIPTLPLWLALAAALPTSWGPVQRYFAITVILAIVAWTGLARVVRGRFLALRSDE